MRPDVVLIGIGEMGGVLARGLLRDGCTVHPVTRETNVAELARDVPAPERVVVAVGEDDLAGALAAMPNGWRDRLVLLQNELLPSSWTRHGIATASVTVLVAWFEKKKGRDVTAILPSPVYGPGADRLAAALTRVEVPTRVIGDDELVYELVRKNLYILVANLAGLARSDAISVGELWNEEREIVEEVMDEVLALQEALAGVVLPRARLRAGVQQAVDADPQHGARGRSAGARLKRAVEAARRLGIGVPRLEALGERL